MTKQSKAQRATRTAAATAARRAARAPTARSLPCASAPSGGLASANLATSVGPAGSSSALVVDVAAAAAPAPPPSPPTAPPTPQRPAPGLRRLIPCAYCVDALLASSSAALCVDNVASGRRSKRCRRCASGHSCRPLPEVLEPLGIELVEELIRSGGTTTARVTELRAAIRTIKGLIDDGYYGA